MKTPIWVVWILALDFSHASRYLAFSPAEARIEPRTDASLFQHTVDDDNDFSLVGPQSNDGLLDTLTFFIRFSFILRSFRCRFRDINVIAAPCRSQESSGRNRGATQLAALENRHFHDIGIASTRRLANVVRIDDRLVGLVPIDVP